MVCAMLLDVPYGEGTLQAELPERTAVIGGGAQNSLPPVGDLEATARAALTSPLGSPPVGELVRHGSRVTIAFDDPTVSSFGPVRRVVIEQLLDELTAAGVDRGDVTLICANALHRKYRHTELAKLLGEELVEEFGERLFCHDAEDPENLVYLGQTPGGYDVEISRYVVDSDLTIYVNASHNRGFSGGWKSVCVGLSTYRSIRHHHTPDGMSMSLGKNRMHAMLDEMGSLLESKIGGKIFKVDTLLSSPTEVARIFAGSVWDSRTAVLAELNRLFPPRRSLSDKKYDAIVYGVPNWSPYAIYSFMNPLLTLVSSGLGYLGGTVQALGKPGCTVVMVTPCPNQWDEVHHASYPDVWKNVLSRTRDPYQIQHEFARRYAEDEPLIEKYRHEHAFHPVHAILAAYPLKRLKHVGRVIVVGCEDPALPRHLDFEPVDTMDAALASIESEHGGDYQIAYIEQPPVPSKEIL